jgi:predicted lipid-binding transport protein (Tim44 family)
VELGAGIATVTEPQRRWLRSLATLAALALGLLTWTEDADARLEGGLSAASSRASVSTGYSRLVSLDTSSAPAAAPPGHPGSLGGLFSRPGLLGGFAAGFLGSGVLGLLFGHGVVDELSGIASVTGLIFQLALIVMLARLIWTWWRDDRANGFAALSPRQLADAYGRPRHEGLPTIDAAEAALDESERDALSTTHLHS